MRTYSFMRVFLLAALFVMFTGHVPPASADDTMYISMTVGNEDFQPVTLGRTIRMYIDIVNLSAHAVRANSFTCIQTVGNSYRLESVSRLPGTIAANTRFYSEQYMHAVMPGASDIQCVLKGTDVVTGQPIMITETIHLPLVLSETRLSVNAYSASQTVTVGQTVFLTVLYTNRSQSTLTNITANCPQLGRGIIIEGQQQNYTTLRPNESGFVQFRLKVLYAGALYLCKVNATVSSTNEIITVPAPPVAISLAQ